MAGSVEPGGVGAWVAGLCPGSAARRAGWGAQVCVGWRRWEGAGVRLEGVGRGMQAGRVCVIMCGGGGGGGAGGVCVGGEGADAGADREVQVVGVGLAL